MSTQGGHRCPFGARFRRFGGAFEPGVAAFVGGDFNSTVGGEVRFRRGVHVVPGGDGPASWRMLRWQACRIFQAQLDIQEVCLDMASRTNRIYDECDLQSRVRFHRCAVRPVRPTWSVSLSASARSASV